MEISTYLGRTYQRFRDFMNRPATPLQLYSSVFVASVIGTLALGGITDNTFGEIRRSLGGLERSVNDLEKEQIKIGLLIEENRRIVKDIPRQIEETTVETREMTNLYLDHLLSR